MRCLLLLLAAIPFAALPACGSKDDTPAPPASGDGDTQPAPADAATTGSGPKAPAMTGTTGVDPATAKRLAEAMAKGRAFLAARQEEDGGWGDAELKVPANVGFTGMGVLGLVAATDKLATRSDPAILKGLRYLAQNQRENGAVTDNPQYTNYHTSVSIGAFAAARVAEFAKTQADALAYLVGSQIIADEADPSYGGFPYKQATEGQPADLSNGQMAAQAMYDARLPEDHAAWKAMQRYLGRVQSNSEVNDYVAEVEVDGESRTVIAGNDGGGYYHPAESKAGMVKRSDGKWEFRSYGSMSYALLKCLLFAGVDPADRRVQIVVRWISDNWTMERNPGFENAKDPVKESQQGYYYYLYTAARALAEYERAADKPLTIKDADGRTHNWRVEMVHNLLKRQADDGSWRNEHAERWGEDSRVLVTSYALQCLAFVTGRLP